MAFQFKTSSCVVAGTFNTYVFQPDWLIRNELVPKDCEILVETNIGHPGMRLSAVSLPVRWLVLPTGITIETEDEGTNCGEIISRVVDILKHTPLQAIANNTMFQAPVSEPSVSAVYDCFERMQLPSNVSIKTKGVAFAVMHGDTQFNLSVFLSDDAVLIGTNAHTPLPAPAPEKAAAVARSFFEHRSFAKRMLADLFRAEFAG